MNIIMSINAVHYQSIKTGHKKHEYRFKFPKSVGESKVYLYVPKSKKEIVGYIEIKNIIFMQKDEAIEFYAKNINIQFDAAKSIMSEWISHRNGCFVIEIKRLIEFIEPIPLLELRNKFNFTAPQNYIYVKNNDLAKFLSSKANKIKSKPR